MLDFLSMFYANRTHHLRPKLMRTWQKRLFTQTAQKLKNGLALGVRVNVGQHRTYSMPPPSLIPMC